MRKNNHRRQLRLEPFDWFNIPLMILMMFVMVYPFWYTVVGSLNEGMDYIRGGVYWWPRKFTLYNYKAVFIDTRILQAFWITICKCVVGTATSVLFTSLVSYAITRPNLKFKKYYIPFMMVTLFFSGGLIPFFILIQNLQLYDTFWVYIIPSLFSVYNMIIIQSFMRELPNSLIESAKIDGAWEYRIFFQIIIPLSKPVLATIALFTMVNHWNSYFDSMMYTNSQWLQTIQLFLKKVITDPSVAGSLSSAAAAAVPDQAVKLTPQTIKLATMTVTAIPIVLTYPFLQKYFVKGFTMGAVKG
ncbi:carbohydrate ABC transporter permease [Cohnella sp. LGH]|uniref:carbohydrate ABC transporter permease n=1 Tax=Cohnella sp. LGH TaxID=1619153 RepID=UPI001ADCC052|nr:carbohydrate ABC transporter permease [Cohnella sp. LGH]QTH43150.1 carbohydrate ABC transporter permease [Cohnella sp. LGH]